MGVLPPTPTLGMVLPDPGTNQPFSTATQNGWFQTIDTAVGDDRTRIGVLEPLVLPSSPTPGLIPAGTSAQRDAFWGIPGSGPANAGARVALANKAARWFNTDKGWEERYFSQFDDAGMVLKNSATVHGWKALGRQLVHATTLTPTGGTAVDQGSQVLITGATAVLFQGIFTDDFEDYELEFFGASSANPTNLTWRVASGAVLETGAGVYGSNTLAIVNAAVTGAYAASNVGHIGELGGPATKSPFRLAMNGPKLAAYTTWTGDGVNVSAGRQWRVAGAVLNTTAYDGFWMGAAGMTGIARVYGIGR